MTAKKSIVCNSSEVHTILYTPRKSRSWCLRTGKIVLPMTSDVDFTIKTYFHLRRVYFRYIIFNNRTAQITMNYITIGVIWVMFSLKMRTHRYSWEWNLHFKLDFIGRVWKNKLGSYRESWVYFCIFKPPYLLEKKQCEWNEKNKIFQVIRKSIFCFLRTISKIEVLYHTNEYNLLFLCLAYRWRKIQ